METTNQDLENYYFNGDCYNNVDQMYCPYTNQVEDEQTQPTYNEPDNEEMSRHRSRRPYYPYYYGGYPPYGYGWSPYAGNYDWDWDRDAEFNQRHDDNPTPYVHPNQIQPNTAQPNTAQPNTVQPNAVQPNAVQPNAVQPNAVQPNAVQPNAVQPNTMQPNAVEPILKPEEKNYKAFKSLENNVDAKEIIKIMKEIKHKHPYMMKKLMTLGLVEKECKKVIYLILMCSGKFDVK